MKRNSGSCLTCYCSFQRFLHLYCLRRSDDGTWKLGHRSVTHLAKNADTEALKREEPRSTVTRRRDDERASIMRHVVDADDGRLVCVPWRHHLRLLFTALRKKSGCHHPPYASINAKRVDCLLVRYTLSQRVNRPVNYTVHYFQSI